MSTWHYNNKPIIAPGYVPPKPVPVDDAQNAVWAINDSCSTLSSVKEDTYGQSKSILGKTIALRNLVHFLGDIHQPLHATNRFSAEHPDGDQGGNKFKIVHYSNSRWNNIHFIWDHLFDLGKEVDSPLDKEGYEYVSMFAKKVMSLYKDDEQF